MWAILTGPETRDGEWAADAFFASGRGDLAETLRYVRALGVECPGGVALDFGCGIGRLTQAMCAEFDEVHGVDVAPSMIREARKRNRFPKQCRYHVNPQVGLGLFADDRFDFILSLLVLQHMPPEMGKAYLREMLRVLAPGGLLVFQVPETHAPGTPPAGLPDSGFRAEIDPRVEEAAMRAGARVSIAVTVHNASDVTWPATALGDENAIRLGNHWLNESGKVITVDDGRAGLPKDLRPGETAEVSLQVIAPSANGAYFLEFDMVQERVAWFKSKGSTTARVPIRVEGGSHPAGDANPEVRETRPPEGGFRRLSHLWRQEPRMEMHAIGRAAIEELVSRSGARLVDASRFDVAGPEWPSYRYCVTKDRNPSLRR